MHDGEIRDNGADSEKAEAMSVPSLGQGAEASNGSQPVNPVVRFAVERRVTMAMMVAGVLVLGWLSLTRLPLEFLPAFSSTHVSVSAPYPSSSPAETERLIVRPLEDSLGTINGIDSLTATATSSAGTVDVGFADGTDMDMAAVEVRDRVDRVRNQLPDDLERVRIMRFQSSDRPVLRANLSAPWERDRLYRFAEDIVVRRLQRIDGVADVSVEGLESRQLQIDLIPHRMAAHGIDVRDVASVLRANHLTRSAGTIREGTRSLLVRVEGKLRNLEEISKLPLDGGLRVGDVADVSFAYPKQDTFSFLNGSESLTLQVFKTSTANLLNMVDGVKTELEDIVAMPEAEGLDLRIYRDDSKDVREGLSQLRTTGLLGGGLAIFFMFMFLRRVRTTALVAIAIPVSVVMTFVIMYLTRQAGWTEITLNIMSLMGLMLAVGMLVDNSIVVIESIFRHKQELAEDAWTATLTGASEVVRPIAASTLTTMCVFMPMVFLESGSRFAFFMTNIGLTVVIVMAASFTVAVTVVPMVAARLLRKEKPRKHPFFDRVSETYGRHLTFMLRHRLAFAILTVLALVGSLYLYTSIGRTSSPPSFERQVRVNVDVPESYTIDQKRSLYDQVYAIFDTRREELDIMDISHAFQEGTERRRGWHGMNAFNLYLVDEEEATRDTAEIRDRVQALLPLRPGVSFTLGRSMRGHGGSGSGVELRVLGERMEIIEVLSDRIVSALRHVPQLTGADSSLESGDAEVHVRPDPERILQAGLSTQAVGQSISSALSTRPVSYFELEDQEIDIVVQHRELDRQTLDQLRNLPVAFGASQLAIGAVAEFETSPGVRSIRRDDRRASVTVTADTASGVPSFVAQGMAKQALAGIELPRGYEISEGQEWHMGREDAAAAAFMLVFALVLVYMVMASLFESFAQPFTIMFSVPFAFIGVGLIMKLAGQPRSQIADIGLIILAGIVVNNAIVLVDHINRLRQSGLSRDEAIILGGRHRLRPILMTAMTTILGLSPMVAPFFLPQVFGAVDGRAAFWSPMGLVILGGMISSTVLTVAVIPVVYSLVDDLTRFASRIAKEVIS